MNWSDYYLTRVNSRRYSRHFSKKYFTLIDLVVKHINKNEKIIIIEEGCGIGSVSKQLLKHLPNNIYVLFDNNIEMLELAKLNLKKHKKTNLIFEPKDILSPLEKGYLEKVVVTHGVLEHFSDENIKQIVNTYKKLGITQMHYVPTSGYSTPSFGDERLLEVSDWQELTGFTEYTLIEGKDLYFKINPI